MERFTSHEHLDSARLIHMNGRVFDPEIARFLSADPLIQAPNNLQSYNRYSYTLNNPLIFTDPSGYSWLSREWKRAKKRATRLRDAVKGFLVGGIPGAFYGYNYRKARDYGYSKSQAQKQGAIAGAVTGAAMAIGNVACGPPCAAKAAAIAYVMQTPTGRSATQSVSKEVFNDFLGIDDQNVADFLAATVVSSGVDYGIQAGINYYTKPPGLTTGAQPIDPNRLNTSDPLYGDLIENQGVGAQGNITKIGIDRAGIGGKVYPLYNDSGEVVGLIGASPAWSQGAVENGLVTHTATVLQSPGGQYYNSMRGAFTGSSKWCLKCIWYNWGLPPNV